MAFDDRTLHPQSLVEDVPVRFRDWLPRNFDHSHHGRRDRAPRPAAVAEHAGRAGPAEGRAAALPRRPCAPPACRPACRRARRAHRWALRWAAPPSRRWRWPGLYAGLANGGQFAPPIVRRDRPKPEPVRLIGPAAAWYVGDVLADAPLPEGFASLPVALRDRRVAYKTGTSAGFRDAWAAGYSANWTVVVWVGHADGTPRPGALGRLSALPILFKAFGRLPAEDNRAVPAPRRRAARRLVARPAAAHADAGARGRDRRRAAHRLSAGRCPHRAEGPRGRAAVRAAAAKARLRWLVDGRPLDGTRWVPDGPGTARVAVVDEAGPLERRHGAHRRAALERRASTTEASSSTAKARLMARLVRGSRNRRVSAAPAISQAMLTAAMISSEHRHLGGDVERQPLAHQHEAGEQGRHGGVALGIDQRQQEPAGKGGRPPLRDGVGQRRRGGDAEGEIDEVGRRQHRHDRTPRPARPAAGRPGRSRRSPSPRPCRARCRRDRPRRGARRRRRRSPSG